MISGGAGFIGANFLQYLLKVDVDVRVVNLDALTYAGSLLNLDNIDQERHLFVKGDICDIALVEKLIREEHVETIIHFAAESHVDRSISAPLEFVKTNVMGTATLLEAARRVWFQNPNFELASVRFHHVSTDEVYGTLGPEDDAFSELTPYAPNSPYSASKASSDHFVRAYAETYALPITISNCSNNYGPYQFPEKLIPLTIVNALSGKSLPVYGDGQQIRDWLFVEDHCSAIWKVVQDGVVGETYNIGGDNQITNLELVKAICSALDEKFPESPNIPHSSLIKFVTDRPGHDRRYAMNIDKIGRDLNWQPTRDLQQGLKETIDWYLSNREWVISVSTDPRFQEWVTAQYEQAETV